MGIRKAFAAYLGPNDPPRTQRLLSNLEYARLNAPALETGPNLDPEYTEDLFVHEQMPSGEYRSGGLCHWWGGARIATESESRRQMHKASIDGAEPRHQMETLLLDT
jgi:hypothetical protein